MYDAVHTTPTSKRGSLTAAALIWNQVAVLHGRENWSFLLNLVRRNFIWIGLLHIIAVGCSEVGSLQSTSLQSTMQDDGLFVQLFVDGPVQRQGIEAVKSTLLAALRTTRLPHHAGATPRRRMIAKFYRKRDPGALSVCNDRYLNAASFGGP
jgi:hypothetical protein